MSQKNKNEKTDFNFLISQRLGLTYREFDRSDAESLILLNHWQNKTPYDYELCWDSKKKEHTVTLYGKSYGICYRGLSIKDAIVEAFKDLYLSGTAK